MQKMNLLVTLDQNYMPALEVFCWSLFTNNPGAVCDIYMIYDDIDDASIRLLDAFCTARGGRLIPIPVANDFFADAPINRYLTRAMYYRLLACELLPQHLDRILYLDPDILIINPLDTLYNLDIDDYLFAGAAITDITRITGFKDRVNRARLGTEAEGYYNSGVLLMNLKAHRKEIKSADIFSYVKEHEKTLLLPDQDVLNALYGERFLPIDDSLYNYNAQLFDTHRFASGGEKDMDWVMQNTCILHFCGRNKPWHQTYSGRFGSLYKHYMQLTKRHFEAIEL